MGAALEPTNPFEILAGHPALDFINTLDDRYSATGPLELLTSYARLLEFCEQAGALTGDEGRHLRRAVKHQDGDDALRRAIDLREALHTLVESMLSRTVPPASALDTLNRVLRDTETARTIAWDKPRFTWHMDEVKSPALTPLGRLADAAAHLLTSEDVAHIRECGSETCRWLFLDRSRNHTRRWCDMKMCGNRNKARRFHTRQASAQQRDG